MAWPEDDIDLDDAHEPHAVGGGDVWPGLWPGLAQARGASGRILDQFFNPKGQNREKAVRELDKLKAKAAAPADDAAVYLRARQEATGVSYGLQSSDHVHPVRLETPEQELARLVVDCQLQLNAMRTENDKAVSALAGQVTRLVDGLAKANKDLEQLRVDMKANHNRLALRLPDVELPAPEPEKRKTAQSAHPVERFVGYMLRLAFWSILLSFLLLLPLFLNHRGWLQ